jgi:hypothetical protein
MLFPGGHEELARGTTGRVRRGKERLLVTPAGTVRATPVDVVGEGGLVERVWVSPEVPVLPLAQWELPSVRQRIRVAGFGHGAAPRIRPAAQAMEAPP